MQRSIWLLLLMATISCAHPPPQEGSKYYLGRYDQLNRAPAAAYAADGFFIQRQMTHRPVRPKHPYFHKSCELEKRSHSRDYSCSSLPWVSDPLGF